MGRYGYMQSRAEVRSTMHSAVTARGDAARELVRFAVVGASGYLINLAMYTVLIHAGLHYLPAAAGSFAVAVANNYSWNRLWTFRCSRGNLYDQGLRFLVVSLCTLGANLLLLKVLVGLTVGTLAAQAIVIVLVAPLSFLGSKAWAFASPDSAAAG